MRTLCYSVKLESLIPISPKCYKAVAYDGSEALIPASQYFGEDYDKLKSNAHWISAWILGKKNLQYSAKKEAWFDNESGKQLPKYTFDKHVPKKLDNKNVKPDESLTR